MFKLSKRLKKIVDMCETVDTIADIASDYGYVPIYLSNNNYAKKIIISDININSINKINENINKYAIYNNFSVRQGDGLNILNYNEADIIIISGIGFDLLKKILVNINKFNFKFLILSPQTKFIEFKNYLTENNLNIVDEEIVEENKKFYFIYKINKGVLQENLNCENIIYPIKLLDNKNLVLKKYILEQIKNLKTIINNNSLNQSSSLELNNKLDYNIEILKKYYEN